MTIHVLLLLLFTTRLLNMSIVSFHLTRFALRECLNLLFYPTNIFSLMVFEMPEWT